MNFKPELSNLVLTNSAIARSHSSYFQLYTSEKPRKWINGNREEIAEFFWA